jgi:RNA polymerase sigma-70 factor (ECF subfamily)
MRVNPLLDKWRMFTEYEDASGPASGTVPVEEFVARARAGDSVARQQLCHRTLPALRRWASRCRECGIHDADDLVQNAFLRALDRLDEFEVRGNGSFLAYLRQIVVNDARREWRRQRTRGETVEIDEGLSEGGDPVVEAVLGDERERAYAGALRRLNPRQRKHISLRVECGMSFGEIAGATGGSVDGARMIVTRALRTLSLQLAMA